nr:cyclin A2-1 [Crypthecodinium cohnii]
MSGLEMNSQTSIPSIPEQADSDADAGRMLLTIALAPTQEEQPSEEGTWSVARRDIGIKPACVKTGREILSNRPESTSSGSEWMRQMAHYAQVGCSLRAASQPAKSQDAELDLQAQHEQGQYAPRAAAAAATASSRMKETTSGLLETLGLHGAAAIGCPFVDCAGLLRPEMTVEAPMLSATSSAAASVESSVAEDQKAPEEKVENATKDGPNSKRHGHGHSQEAEAVADERWTSKPSRSFRRGGMTCGIPSPFRLSSSSSQSQPKPQSQPDSRIEMLDLPGELVQVFADWLPTFGNRLVFRASCRKTAACVDWQFAAPYRADEEQTDCLLDDRGAKAVAEALRKPWNLKLRELRMGSNSISDAGASALAAALAEPGCRLRRLSLRDNRIGDVGGRALAKALTEDGSLEELDLWGNCMSDEVKTLLLEAASKAAARCTIFLELDAPPRCLDRSVRSGGRLSSWTTSPRLHRVLFDWLSQVHIGVQSPAAFDANPDPQDLLFRGMSNVDAYILSGGVADRSELQVVAVACTLAAAGLTQESDFDRDEMEAWLAFVTDGSCTVDEVMERCEQVRKHLGFRMHQPTAYTFLRRFLRWTGWSEESFSFANYLIELGMASGFGCSHKPQALAVAAAVLSRQYSAQGLAVPHMPRWKCKLTRCAQLDVRKELAPCIAALAQLHSSLHDCQSLFINRKYTWARFHGVSRITPNIPFNAEFYVRYLEAEWAH